MTQYQNTRLQEYTSRTKKYDLEERAYRFAGDAREFVKMLPKEPANFEDGKQLIKSSGSVAANYIEANEALSKRDFVHRIKICRKESKESQLWLTLCNVSGSEQLMGKQQELIQEASELTKIFGSIIEKSK